MKLFNRLFTLKDSFMTALKVSLFHLGSGYGWMSSVNCITLCLKDRKIQYMTQYEDNCVK